MNYQEIKAREDRNKQRILSVNPNVTEHSGYAFSREFERRYIYDYALGGFQLKNKTAGGQDKGKVGIAENRPARGYRDGVKQGYENARREVKHLFDLPLNVVTKADKPSKLQEKALQKFKDFLEGESV